MTLHELCEGRVRCNRVPTETCCGRHLCAEHYHEHRYDECDVLEDEVRRELYPQGCDHTFNASVCHVCVVYVGEEIRRRADEVQP